MSGKESRVGRDPVEGIGSLAREPDNQERGDFESPNSGVAGSSGMQSNSCHQVSLSGQMQEGGSDAVSSCTCGKKTTDSLTDSYGKKAEKG